ncbi:sulfatase family protein [Emticicia agri]|uniref:Heparan N-sulfatase n=1 Tax=Emticicia agri TaxID=2492393 RepID=A0A4Q5M1J8_9BACT|nr:sulfatase [Emticicia agri]RYU96082.1 heparan N-sulfatase [Emticicia agri]
MKKYSGIAILLLIGIVLSAWLKKPEATAPNIIFIIGDDISHDDIGSYGNPLVKTPNIDRLAKEGLQFNNMFVTSSSCSPSRTSILTGRYPHNTGAAELHTELPAHLTYFPEQLRKAGYYTALMGKWHEGKNTKRAYDTLLAGEKLNGLGGEDQWINVLQARPKDKPFFFWLSPFDAHREWSADNFKITHNPDNEVRVPATLLDTKATRKDLASYYNEIGRLDYYIGELWKELERQGVADNTIIIFTADNARAFPGNKTLLYDRGIKTPFIMKWQAGIKSQQQINALVSTIDIAPTLLQLAGIKPAITIQGQSFASLLKTPEADFRKYIFAEHNWHDYQAYERAIRTKDFLYLINLRPELDNGGSIDANQSPSALALKENQAQLTNLQKEAFIKPRPTAEFYDMRSDAAQTNNLINDPKYKSTINQLKSVLQTWQTQTGDTNPLKTTPDWYDRETGKAVPAKDIRGEMPGVARQADKINVKGPF